MTPPTPRLMIIRATIRPGSPAPCFSKGGIDVIRSMVSPTAYMLQKDELSYRAKAAQELRLTKSMCEASCSGQNMNLQELPSREA